MTERPDKTAMKIREEIETMLSVAREVETEVKANPGAGVSRTDRIIIETRREQLEEIRELLLEMEQTLRDSNS